jgi:LPS-assembly protein
MKMKTKTKTKTKTKNIFNAILMLICGYGYNYYNIANAASTNTAEDKAIIEADQIDGQQDNIINIKSTSDIPAKIWYQNKYIQGDDISYDLHNDKITAKNNISNINNINNENKVIIEDGNIQISTTNATYEPDAQKANVSKSKYKFINSTAHGESDSISMDRHIIDLKNATYTTCSEEDMPWYIRSSELEIDRREDLAQVKNARLYFMGVPILATPYFSMPLNNKRRSGFLVPRFSINSRNGIDVTTPYYFNIAPQHDLTIMPRILSKRGLLIASQSRYLRENYHGQLLAELLPNDRQTKTNRWSLALQHEQNIKPWLQAYIDARRVSDKSYADDFGMNIKEYSNRLYSQEIGLRGAQYIDNKSIQFLLRYKHHQILTNDEPYDLLPQANVLYKQNISSDEKLKISIENDFSNFKHKTKADGKRLFNDINLSYNIDSLAYYIKPNLRLHSSYYALNGYTSSKIIPSISIDAGMFFERDVAANSLITPNGKQTLEPRLFYVYTPYKNQNDVPLFDSSEPEFGYNALFSNNRFIGNDRIADANQITAGLTSRWLDEQGNEKATLSLAQRYQFNDTKVNIDNKIIKGYSDILLQGMWSPHKSISFSGDIQANPNDKKLSKLSSQINWKPDEDKNIGIGYKYRQKTDSSNNTPFKQVVLSANWTLNPQWKFNTQTSYDLQSKNINNMFLGLDYTHNCWYLLAGIDRTIGSDGKYNTRAVMQASIKGMKF